MTSIDREYYRRREQQEREIANRCDDHGARLVHLAMADRYAQMLREMPVPAAFQPGPTAQAG